MNKVSLSILIGGVLAALFLLPVLFAGEAEAKEKKNKSTVTPIIVQTPAPKPTTPKPSFMQQQINNALAQPKVHPLANCTYCGAFAASQGDLATVEAIGAVTP